MEPMCTKQYTRWYERELVTPSYLFFTSSVFHDQISKFLKGIFLSILRIFHKIKKTTWYFFSISSKYLHDPIWKLSNLPFPFCFLLDKNG